MDGVYRLRRVVLVGEAFRLRAFVKLLLHVEGVDQRGVASLAVMHDRGAVFMCPWKDFRSFALDGLGGASAGIGMLAEFVSADDELLTAVAFAKVKDGVPSPSVGAAWIPLQNGYHPGSFFV